MAQERADARPRISPRYLPVVKKPTRQNAMSGIAVVSHGGSLYHRGALDNPQARTFTSSHEGPCLSCSPSLEVDDAWQMIAKLGGRQLWKLRKPGRFCLADFHALAKAQLLDEARALGLVAPCVAWRRSWYDDEAGSSVYMLHESKKDARDDRAEGDRIRPIRGWVATEELQQYWRRRHPVANICLLSAPTAAVICLLDLHYPRIDGVYWNDTLAPEILSAPRVGLFQRTLAVTKKELWADA